MIVTTPRKKTTILHNSDNELRWLETNKTHAHQEGRNEGLGLGEGEGHPQGVQQPFVQRQRPRRIHAVAVRQILAA